jgi:ABC-type multidrug transport system ATPase subunit
MWNLANSSLTNLWFIQIGLTLYFRNILRFFSAVAATQAGAEGFAMGSFAVFFTLSGFLITYDNITGLAWLVWPMPFTWAWKALMLNEFTASDSKFNPDITVANFLNGELIPCPASLCDETCGNPQQVPVSEQCITNNVCPFEDVSFCTQGGVTLALRDLNEHRRYIFWGLGYLYMGAIFWLICYTLAMAYMRVGQKEVVLIETPEDKIQKASFEKRRSSLMNGGGTRPSIDLGTVDLAAIQTTPILLTLRDLCYTVQVKDKDGKTVPKELLTKVNAHFKPGTLTALMGASGAGKTTLMDVIAGLKNSGTIDGEMLVNGHPIEPAVWRRYMGYVEQRDLHMANATVLEALTFAARCRLDGKVYDAKQADAIVRSVADLIELTPILQKKVGTATNGLSVEQRKRLTIGVEMVAMPSILFLDEPTSGLDSRSARIVMRVIRNIAAAGRTVVCTIHQPSEEIFGMFDRLLLLQRGGEVAYYGDLGPTSNFTRGDGSTVEFYTAKEMCQYLEKQIPGNKMAEDQNPAEFMLESLNGAKNKYSHLDAAKIDEEGDAPADETAEEKFQREIARAKVDVDFAANFRETDMFKDDIKHIEHLAATKGEKLHADRKYGASFLVQVQMNTKRWWTLLSRDVGFNTTRIIVLFLVALLYGSVFCRQDITNSSLYVSKNGVFYSAAFFTAMVQGIMVVPVLADSKTAYYRERASLTYSTAAFLIGRTVCEIPWIMLVSGIWMLVFYPMTDMSSDVVAIIITFIGINFFCAMMINFAELFSVLFPTAGQAEALYATTGGLMNLFAGFFMPVDLIPWPWKLFYYIDPARFG